MKTPPMGTQPTLSPQWEPKDTPASAAGLRRQLVDLNRRTTCVYENTWKCGELN